MPSYAYKLLVACDQLMNAILGGWPDFWMKDSTENFNWIMNS